jgi:hypothetical protein
MTLYVCQYKSKSDPNRSNYVILRKSPIDPKNRCKPTKDPDHNINRLIRFSKINENEINWIWIN